VDGKLIDKDRQVVGQLPVENTARKIDGQIRLLCQQTVDAGNSVLVFSAFKKVNALSTLLLTPMELV
jgi:hypothetical protein